MIDKPTAQSLLYSYRYLFRTCNLIDNMISNYATNFGVSYDHYDTEELANRMIELMQRKKYLINLKLFIDKVISLTDGTSQKVLTLMSQFNYGIKNVTELCRVSERTAFRYMNKALADFISVANRVKGLDLEQLKTHDNWIFNLCHTYSCSRCLD